MAHRWAILVACAVVVASTYPLFKASGLNFVPDEDESRFQVFARLPVGSSLASTQSLLDRIARDLRDKIPGVSDTLAITAFGGGGGQSNQGMVFARLLPIEDRAFSQAELVTRARALIEPYRRDAVVAVQSSNSSAFGRGGGGGGGGGIQYALSGPDLEKLG